jgi:hypothetical protein
MRPARWVNVVAGGWLFISAWLLPEPTWQRINQGLLGMGIFLVAFVAMAYSRCRLVNTLLGLWATVSPFILALAASLAAVNQEAFGFVVLTASLWPSHGDITHGHFVPR